MKTFTTLNWNDNPGQRSSILLEFESWEYLYGLAFNMINTNLLKGFQILPITNQGLVDCLIPKSQPNIIESTVIMIRCFMDLPAKTVWLKSPKRTLQINSIYILTRPTSQYNEGNVIFKNKSLLCYSSPLFKTYFYC